MLGSKGIEPILMMTVGSPAYKNPVQALDEYDFYEKDILTPIYDALDSGDAKGHSPNKSLNQMLAIHDCQAFHVRNLSDECVIRTVNDPNLIGAISVRNLHIFSAELIAKVKAKGFFWNFHPGLLPELRGIYIPFWSLSEKRPTYGCTLHEIERGIDTGGIVARHELPLDHAQSMLHAYIELVEHGAHMIEEALDTYIATGTVLSQSQDSSQARYYSFPTDADIAAARKSGLKLWGSPIEMLRLYQTLFGHDEILAERIATAIMSHHNYRAVDGTYQTNHAA